MTITNFAIDLEVYVKISCYTETSCLEEHDRECQRSRESKPLYSSVRPLQSESYKEFDAKQVSPLFDVWTADRVMLSNDLCGFANVMEMLEQSEISK